MFPSKNRQSPPLYIKKHVFNVKDDGTCKICRAERESIKQIISACNGLSPTKYLNAIITLVNAFMSLATGEWIYQKIHTMIPTQVSENNSTEILWNFAIQTDHEAINKKPGITAVDKIIKTANLIEVTVPNDYNNCKKRL